MYILSVSDNYPQKLIGIYDASRSPDRFQLLKGEYIKKQLPSIYIKVKATVKDVLEYDNIVNNAGLLLVNKKVIKIIDDLCEFDVQYFDTIIECKNGKLNTYKIINITHTIFNVDYDKSVYELFEGSDSVFDFKHLSLKRCINIKHDIAREHQYKSLILISQKLYDAFKINKIKGITLITEEQFNNIGKVRIP